MKNLSNEELIQKLVSLSWVAGSNDHEGYDEAVESRAELLRRLEQGDRAIKACKEIAAMEIQE